MERTGVVMRRRCAALHRVSYACDGCRQQLRARRRPRLRVTAPIYVKHLRHHRVTFLPRLEDGTRVQVGEDIQE